MLAPVVLFTYNRPLHLKRTISALAKNKLIAETELYIFQDGSKNSSDKEKAEEVKKLIEEFTSAKTIHKIFRKENYGLAKSVIAGVTEVFKSHDAVIVLEDDLVTSPNFLDYMNSGLKYYENNSRIHSITGYSLPLKTKLLIDEDVFFSPRAGSWGWATWKDRWTKPDWDVSDYEEFKRSLRQQKEFNVGGEDLTPMLKAQMRGDINSWAIRWSYYHFKMNGLCVYPKISKVNHIGNDSEGTHVSSTKKYDVEIDDTNRITSFVDNVSVNKIILKEINQLVRPSFIRKIINFFKYDFLK